MDQATVGLLLGASGRELLDYVQTLPSDFDDLALGTQLRKDYEPDLVAAAMSQYQLRQKAVKKFGEQAQHMWFTPDALEQSTRFPVAQHRAQRLAALGVEAVVDLGCGIGGDLIACAQTGISVRGIEIDPVRAALAQANLEALSLPGTVTIGDALTTPTRPHEVAFVDPARRDGRGRVFTLDGLQPSWEFVTSLLAGRAVAKVMPGIAHDAIPAGVEAEWVSDHGSLVEASLWGAGFGFDAQRRATALPSGVSLQNRESVAQIGGPQTFLVEPDDAVIRSGLVAEFANAISGQLLDPKIAWVTTETPPPAELGHLGAWFRLINEVPFHSKALKAELQSRDIGTLTVKKRGVDIVPERLIAGLKLRGSQTATLVMTRVDNRGAAFLVEPLPHSRLGVG